jgi:hypothetical protein
LYQETHNLVAGFTGQTGGTVEIFSNVMYSTGKDADGGGNFWVRVDLHDTDPGIEWNVIHNTIIYTTGFGFTLYEATATDWDDFNSTQNIVVGESVTTYENGSGVDAAHVVFDNYHALTADIADLLFTNTVTRDYHLTSLLSPAFDTWTETPMVSTEADYDFEGYKYKSNVAGAFSGAELTN